MFHIQICTIFLSPDLGGQPPQTPGKGHFFRKSDFPDQQSTPFLGPSRTPDEGPTRATAARVAPARARVLCHYIKEVEKVSPNDQKISDQKSAIF